MADFGTSKTRYFGPPKYRVFPVPDGSGRGDVRNPIPQNPGDSGIWMGFLAKKKPGNTGILSGGNPGFLDFYSYQIKNPAWGRILNLLKHRSGARCFKRFNGENSLFSGCFLQEIPVFTYANWAILRISPLIGLGILDWHPDLSIFLEKSTAFDEVDFSKISRVAVILILHICNINITC